MLRDSWTSWRDGFLDMQTTWTQHWQLGCACVDTVESQSYCTGTSQSANEHALHFGGGKSVHILYLEYVSRRRQRRMPPAGAGRKRMAVSDEKNNDSVRAVGRALEILLAFTPADFELSPAELLKRVDLSRPTLYRLLYTLESNGFLVSSGDPQKFRLGSAVAHMAHVWTSSHDPAASAMPMLRRVRGSTNETVGLFVRKGDRRVCIAELPSSQPLSFSRGVGFQDRLALGASGKVILAHSALEPRQLRQLTQNSGIDLAAYAGELKKTRSMGYAISRDEQVQGATSIAVPFFDASGTVAGSLAVYGPSVRFDATKLEKYAALLMAEASRLSRAMGYQWPVKTPLK